MARQVLHAHAQVEIMCDARMADVEARLRKVLCHGVVCAAPLPVADKARETRELLFFEAERLAHFARRRAAAIGDDVGGHGRAQRAVALVDVLDDLFAMIARGQIEIDVGPFAAVLAQEIARRAAPCRRDRRR